jgi:arylesterase / paraoxonase
MKAVKSKVFPQIGKLIFGTILSLVVGCAAIPKAPLAGEKQIHIGPGTEDIVLDDFSAHDRLLISCADRRHGDDFQFGEIVSYDLASGDIDTMVIKEYPIGMAFRPHGLDLVQIDNRLMLFVVCHDNPNGHHWIASFQVIDKELYWIRNYQSGLLVSPNAVTALPDGSLFVTNDHKIYGSNKEALLKQKRAEIIHFDANGDSKIAFKGLCYGNGITYRNGYVYAAATVENAIYRFKVEQDGTLSEQTKIAKVNGPDNLRWDGEDLIVACHYRLLKFVKHAKSADNHSPTVVCRIQPGNLKPTPLYADKKGETISGGATGLIYKDRLFIGQVFEDWIIELKQ